MKNIRGMPPKQTLLIKNCVLFLTCLNFRHLPSTLYLMQYTYRDIIFHCSKQFLNSSVLMPFSASAIFCFSSSSSGKHFPLMNLFIQGNKQKRHSGQDRVNAGGYGGHAIFGQKLLNPLHSVGRCACKSPIMKWANVLKGSSKKMN